MNLFAFFLIVALLAPGPAAADPITAAITSVLVSAGASAAAAGWIASFVVRAFTSFALSALGAAIKGRPEKPRQPGIKTEHTTTGGTNPQTFILGRYATAGNLVAPPYSAPAPGGSIPNQLLTYVVDFSDLPGVTPRRLIVNEEYVDLAASQAAADLQHQLSGKPYDGADHLLASFYDGSQVGADPYMAATYGDHAERPWTEAMIGAGISYAVVSFHYSRALWNQLPAVRFEVDGIPLYDPRADGSVGGSGAQRWADPGTWAQSNNPAVMIYNILRGITLPDGRVWGGRVPIDDLPLDDWFAAFNACDDPVALAEGGSEPAYQAGFEVSLDMDPAGVVDELAKACSAEISELGGVYRLRVGPPPLPVYFFTDADIVADEPERLAPYPGLDGVHNAIHAAHPAPEALWQPTDAPPRYNAEWEAEDAGRQLVAHVDLPAVWSGSQAQRLMQAWIEDERRFRRHSLVLPPEAAVLGPLDTVGWTSARHGYTSKIFELAEISDDLVTGLQAITIRERDAADFEWNPAADERVKAWPNPALPVAPAWLVPGFYMQTATVSDQAGVARRAALRLVWNGAGLGGLRGLEYQVRPLGQTELVAAGVAGDLAAGALIVSAGILPVQSYEGRVRPLADRPVAWSAWRGATTDDVRISTADLQDGLRISIETADQTRIDHDYLTKDLIGRIKSEIGLAEAQSLKGAAKATTVSLHSSTEVNGQFKDGWTGWFVLDGLTTDVAPGGFIAQEIETGELVGGDEVNTTHEAEMEAELAESLYGGAITIDGEI